MDGSPNGPVLNKFGSHILVGALNLTCDKMLKILMACNNMKYIKINKLG